MSARLILPWVALMEFKNGSRKNDRAAKPKMQTGGTGPLKKSRFCAKAIAG
jgi:hypothetical protein